MHHTTDNLLRFPAQGRGREAISSPGLDTGFPELDALLPDGWPGACLAEILVERPQAGELTLLMPVLAELCRERRWIAWIDPPHLPLAPALAARGLDPSRQLLIHTRPGADPLLAMEQGLGSGTCSAVLAWPSALDGRALGRLQQAAERGDARGFVFRPRKAAARASAAALRLQTLPGGKVEILRGRIGGAAIAELWTGYTGGESFFLEPARRYCLPGNRIRRVGV